MPTPRTSVTYYGRALYLAEERGMPRCAGRMHTVRVQKGSISISPRRCMDAEPLLPSKRQTNLGKGSRFPPGAMDSIPCLTLCEYWRERRMKASGHQVGTGS